MKTIQLTQGQVALVSDEDYERTSQYKWAAVYDKRRKIFNARRSVNGKKERMHRFILGVTDPKIDVDHWNHDTLDNTRENLRICTRSQNHANKTKQKKYGFFDRTGRYKGVSWNKIAKRWRSYIQVNYKTRHLGYFDTQEKAALAYNMAALKHFGEFSVLNVIPVK